MKERGMIFNGEMVRALLSGRKTQTRRPIKWKQTRFTEIGEREDGSYWPWSEDAEHACDFWHPCPFGAVGDRIWVREAFASGLSTKSTLSYRATHKREDLEDGFYDTIKWTPSIHMPRWASRILLEITGVRVERLQSITLGDICKEVGCGLYDFRPATYGFQVWEELWKSIYGAESWNANPWVWVIEFKRVEGGAA
ncbi:TPA: hypothetical protein L8Q88_001901 [Klebsiella pneumoniae]|uniref:hypothetical protein n=1 Tax=Klebsiella pneumoniae TaxID=573 RepID=UPI001F1F7BAB|nr:hypothetical protein [Klebsiella pneumoniae]MCF1924805.1 hypothetical protein [Klebsiella pneumoniae]HBQ7496697.1 hypothetical protein [Klebsiella pneumoniae]HBR7570616.1 hypothetical protein [Klebsiella pneumoniae]